MMRNSLKIYVPFISEGVAVEIWTIIFTILQVQDSLLRRS